MKDSLSVLPEVHPFRASFQKYHTLFKSENFALIEKLTQTKSFLDTAIIELKQGGYMDQLKSLLEDEISSYSSCKSRWIDRELRDTLPVGESLFVREYKVCRYLRFWREQIIYAFNKYYDILQETKDMVDSSAIRSSSIMSAFKDLGGEFPQLLSQDLLEGFAAIIDLNGFAQRADLFLPKQSDLHPDILDYLKSRISLLPSIQEKYQHSCSDSPIRPSVNSRSSIGSSTASEPVSPQTPNLIYAKSANTGRGSVVLPPPPPPPPKPATPLVLEKVQAESDDDLLNGLLSECLDRKDSQFESNTRPVELPNFLKASMDPSITPSKLRIPALSQLEPLQKPAPKLPFGLSIRQLWQTIDIKYPKWSHYSRHTVGCRMGNNEAFIVLDVVSSHQGVGPHFADPWSVRREVFLGLSAVLAEELCDFG